MGGGKGRGTGAVLVDVMGRYQTRATSVHRAEAPRNRSTKSGHRLRFRIRQPARLLHVRRRRRPARRAAWIGRELERLVDSTAGRGRLGRGMKHACTRRRPAGEQPAGLFASITGVAERPAVGDSILPQWVVCPSCTFAATRSVSAAAACSANPATFTSSPRRSSSGATRTCPVAGVFPASGRPGSVRPWGEGPPDPADFEAKA